MKALRLHGPGDLRLEDVPEPTPEDGDVLLQVEVALTDGTDLKAYRRGHPVLLGPPPSPFGHEACGIDVATGRRMVVANSAPCGACPACARGQETLCEHLFPLLNGAYAELLLVPERIARTNLLPVPPGLAPEVAAMAEPLACCLHGVDVAGVQRGDTVAIVGLGPIGLMLCACVADAGGHPVGVGSREQRRDARDLRSARPPAIRKARTSSSRPPGPSRRGNAHSTSSVRAAPSSRSAACRAMRASLSTRTGSTTRRCGSSARSTTHRGSSAPRSRFSRAAPTRSSGWSRTRSG